MTEVKSGMEVEVKIRLPNREAYDKAAAFLNPGKVAVYQQENFFFDGANKELSSRRVISRVRMYNKDEKATLTIKGKAIVENGIQRASEVEEELPVAIAREALTNPDMLLTVSKLFDSMKEQFGLTSLMALGGFRNVRTVCMWEGNTMELDETQYEHGTLFEIECETEDPEALRDQLEAELSKNGIQYSYSKTTKFANFVNRSLL